ncbi:efflux RND transporter periplasmic adaptor subunit [Jiella sp. M17.18]|uniref:efflux RND transporter periplasmic adaptor subunit n=1 Tax=Jiella sp. M17.18 TaxID=3234247 RepID=UPI0034DF16C1
MKRILLVLLCAAAIAAYVERDRLTPYLPQQVAGLVGAEKSGQGAGTAAGQGDGSQAASRGGGSHGRGHGQGPTAVTVAEAKPGSLPITFDTIGSVVPVASTTLNSQSVGIVASIAVRNGQRVKAGDLIVQLDDRAAKAAMAKDQAALDRDQAILENDQASLDRIARLVKSGASTKQSGDDAAAAVKQAQASVGVDRAAIAADAVTLSNTAIRAPFDGRLGAVSVSRGALVQPGTAIVTVTEMQPVYAQFSLPETMLPTARAAYRARTLMVNVVPPLASSDEPSGAVASADDPDAGSAAAAGDGASLVASAGPAAPGAASDAAPADAADPVGKVTFIDNAVDAQSATFRLRAEIANVDEALLPGQSLNVHVHLGDRTGLVLVPSVAVAPRENGSMVYVVKPDNTVEMRGVTVAMRSGGVAGLSAGLKPGERVVTEGQADLSNGSQVKVVEPGAGGGSGPATAPGHKRKTASNKLAENGGRS